MQLNGYTLSELDLEIIREDCNEYLDKNNGLSPDTDDSNNWVECIIDGGSWVVDCHMYDNKKYDPDNESKIVIRIYDTYIEDGHRCTDTASDCVYIYLNET